MTRRPNGQPDAAPRKVSHVTRASVDPGEVVGTAWDALRAALRIPDAERREGEKYTTSSARLFDFIGERVRRAASEGATEELIPFRDAAAVVENDVRAGANTLTVNHFSQAIKRWKSGASAAKGDNVERVRRGDTERLLLPADGTPYRVLFEIRSPTETNPKRQLEGPASVRWSIELDGVEVALAPEPRGDGADRSHSRHATASLEHRSGSHRTSAIENPALFSAGIEDALRGVDRIDRSTANPAVRKTTSKISVLLTNLKRFGIVVLILSVPYLAVPKVRAEVNAIIKTAIDYWFRRTTRTGSTLTIHRFSGDPVYRPDPAWLAAGRPLGISHATTWPIDDAGRATILKEAIKAAGGDPGRVAFSTLRWRGGVEGAVVKDAGEGGVVHLLAIPSEPNRYTSLTYVMTSNEINLKTSELKGSYITSVDQPYFGVSDLIHGEIAYVITITMVPNELLKSGETSIAGDCEHVELLLITDDNGKLVAFAPPAAAGGFEFQLF